MSTTWQVELDPTAILPERTPLSLNGREIALDGKKGIDWGEAAIKAYMAENQYGEGVTDFRIPNRIVTIPLVVGARMGGSVAEQETAREELRQKVALFQRQGGALKRQRKGGEPMYAEVVNASLTLPDIYGETGGVEPDGVLKLECIPDFFGEEIALDAVSGSGMIASVLAQGGQQAVIKGNYPARTRLVVTEKSNNNQRGLIYGFRSTRYASSPRARLYFDAAEETMLNGAVAISNTECYTQHWAELAEPEREVWHPFVELTIGEIVNYIHNPTAEAPSTNSWTAGANTTISTDTEQAFSGTHSFTLTATAGGAVKASTQVFKEAFSSTERSSITPAVPGTTFTLSAYLRGKTHARSCKLKIIWLTSGGAEISTTTGTAVEDTTTGWTRLSATGVAPANAAEMKCEVEITGMEAAEVQYLDAVQFEAASEASTYKDGSLAGYMWNTARGGKNNTETLKQLTLTHTGSYRVFARVQTAGTPMKLRLVWSNDTATAPIPNEAVEIQQASALELVDLGEIHIEEPPIGEHFWRGVVQAFTGATSHAVAVDRVFLVPVDDGAGRLRATAVAESNALGPTGAPALTEDNASLHAGTHAWVNPTNAEKNKPGQFAEVAEVEGGTHALVLEQLGFAIPAEGTILGIELEVPYTMSQGAYIEGRLLKAGVAVGSTLASPRLTGSGTLVLGGPSNLWGTTWTPAQVNATNFGGYVYGVVGGETCSIKVYSGYTIRVFYNYSGATLQQDAVVYADRAAELTWEGAWREDLTSGAYAGISEVRGDLPRIPPSGLEKRPVQLFLKNSRGLLPSSRPPNPEPDSAIDAIEVQVHYRPCYIGRI